MDVADLVRVHEARIAHHVAAVRQVDGEDRSAAVLDRRSAVIVQVPGGGQIVASGEEPLEPLQERGVDGQSIGEGPVHRARLLDDDPAVPFEDVGPDLSDVLVDERFDRLLAGQDPGPRRADAGRTQGVGRAGPAERGARTFRALQQRPRGPLRLERPRSDPAVDELKCWPREPGAGDERLLERSQHIHPSTSVALQRVDHRIPPKFYNNTVPASGYGGDSFFFFFFFFFIDRAHGFARQARLLHGLIRKVDRQREEHRHHHVLPPAVAVLAANVAARWP